MKKNLYIYIILLLIGIFIINDEVSAEASCEYAAAPSNSGSESFCKNKLLNNCTLTSSDLRNINIASQTLSNLKNGNIITIDFNNCPLFVIHNTKYFWGVLDPHEFYEFGNAVTEFQDKKSIMTVEGNLTNAGFYPKKYTTFVLYDKEKMQDISKKVKENYKAIGTAVSEFRSYYNYNSSWAPNDGGVTTSRGGGVSSPSEFANRINESDDIPPIGCPPEFSNKDFSKDSYENLLEKSNRVNELTNKYNNIVEAYKNAKTYYMDSNVYPEWQLFFKDASDYKNASLENLMMYYTTKKMNGDDPFSNDKIPLMFHRPSSSDYLKNTYDFDDFLADIVANDYTKYNDVMKILNNNAGTFDYRKNIIDNELKNETIEEVDVTKFVNDCAGNYNEEIQKEINKRKESNQISENQYNEINQNLADTRRMVNLLVGSMTTIYGGMIDFYSDFEVVSCESILTEDFIEWLDWAYKLTEILAVILVIVLSFIEFMKAIASSDGDALKKSSQKFIKRLIALGILFLLPILVNFILNVSGIEGIDSNNPVCIRR